MVYAPYTLWSGFRTPKILLALFALFISGMALQAQSTIPPAFAYQIVGNGNGLVLDVLGAQTGLGTPVDIALSVPSASNQTWQFAAVDSQHYQIASSASGKVLDVYGAQTAPGTVVDIATAVPGAANQEWQLVQLPHYEIISRATGMVLDVYGAQTYNGAPVDIANTIAAAPNQQWKLVSVGGNSYQLVGNRSGKVLDVANAQTAQGTPVDIAFAVPGASNQTWQLAAVDGQYYQIVSTASGKVLDVVGAGTAPGTGIDIATAVPGAFNQEWQFVELPYFQIVSKASGQVLDVYAAQTNQGTPVDIASAVAGAPNQEWMLVPAGTPLPPAVFTISGQVTSGAAGMSGVVVTLSGSQSAIATTDANGHYSFSAVAGGTYTVTPTLSGYSFQPPSDTLALNTNQQVSFAGLSDSGSGGSPDPSEVGIPSQLYFFPDPSGTGSACTSIAGYWIENSIPQAAWSLTQTGDIISGTASASNGSSCGTITWSVSGQAVTSASGVFSVTASNPSPTTDDCGNPAVTPVNETVTISGAGCSQGTADVSSPGGSFNTSWTDPTPPAAQVPTKASLSSQPPFNQPPTSFSANPNVTACDGQTPIDPGVPLWGYKRCLTYTLLDQTTPGKPISNTSHLVASESLTYVKGVKPAHITANSPPGPLSAAAQWGDSLIRARDDHAIPAGTGTVYKQIITVRNTSTGVDYRVRVNCIKYEDSDVTVTDVTSSVDQTCLLQ